MKIPKKAAHYMLEETDGLLFYQLSDHVTQDGANSIESLVCLADVCETSVIK
jgi:hypothetical protein